MIESKKGVPIAYSRVAGTTGVVVSVSATNDIGGRDGGRTDLGKSPWQRKCTMRSSARNPHSKYELTSSL